MYFLISLPLAVSSNTNRSLFLRSVLYMLLQGRMVKGNYPDKLPLSERHEELWIENKKGNLQLAKLATAAEFLAAVIYTKQLVHNKTSDCKTVLQHTLAEYTF